MGRVTVYLFMIIFVFHNTARSQPEPNVADIDRNTYELYLDASWKKLLSAGEEALEQGIDYYYLRMRLGIAAYELEDYSKAIRHFKKALEFNSADDSAMEYLYFAYSFYGRDIEARKTAQGFSTFLKDKLSYDRSTVRSFSLNATGSFLQDHDIIYEYSPDEVPAVDGFQSVTRNFMHFGASLEHDAGNLFKINHSVGYLSKSYLSYIQEGAETYLERDAGLSQFQYYLSGRILLGNGTFMVPAVHYVNVVIPYETTVAGRGRTTFQVQQYSLSHNVAASLGFEKYFGKIKPALAAGYSYINREPQLQGSFTLSWFPAGNLNLYSISGIARYSVLSENEKDGEWILSQEIGFRAFPGLWVELGGSWGERENFAGSHAYLVYNDPLLTKEEYGLALIAPLFERGIELSLHYNFAQKESRFIQENGGADILINPVDFNTHKISGGIKWKF